MTAGTPSVASTGQIESIDPVRLEIWWSRIGSIVDEAATAMLRTAFSTIIRESNDYTVVLMNTTGERIADCRAGIPAFAVALGALTQVLLDRFPAQTWQEGDCVITNDPWIATGHLPDIAMVTPIYHRARLVGFAGTAAHVPDIGGAPTMAPTDLMSEGLLIPPLHLYRGGELNEELVILLRSNVRLAEQVWGDLQAQVAANSVCQRRAVEFLEDTGWNDFETVTRVIHEVADRSMRRGIAGIPDGRYCSVVDSDGVPGSATHIECAVTVAGDAMEISYAGSSKQVMHAVNCTLPYTIAYSLYPLKLLLDPFTRSNDGSYRAISVDAPMGSILNPEFPAPVLARHLTGHLLSCAIYRALADVLPDRVIADSGGAPALRAHFAGIDERGNPFGLLLFASGGMGASSPSDGLSTTAFPTNSGSGSIEALEVSAPLLFIRKTFRADSGGAGEHRGGLGQDVEVRNISTTPVRLTLLGDREHHPPLGLMGGGPGATASAELDNGIRPSLKSVTPVPPGVSVRLLFAGGGGYGVPRERAEEAIREDLAEGLVTPDGARRDYGLGTPSGD
jgi:N-methylhydantoinase B